MISGHAIGVSAQAELRSTFDSYIIIWLWSMKRAGTHREAARSKIRTWLSHVATQLRSRSIQLASTKQQKLPRQAKSTVHLPFNHRSKISESKYNVIVFATDCSSDCLSDLPELAARWMHTGGRTALLPSWQCRPGRSSK